MSPAARCRPSSERRPELSYLGRMLDSMGKSKRRPGPGANHGRPGWQQQAPAEPTGPAQRVSRLSAAQVLEQIEHARLVRDEAEAELAVLIDHAVGLSVGWPEIAACGRSRNSSGLRSRNSPGPGLYLFYLMSSFLVGMTRPGLLLGR